MANSAYGTDEKTNSRQRMTEWNGKAVSFHEKGNYRKAAECMTEAIKAEPDNLVLYSNRSLYYLLAHQFELALKDAEVWTEHKPTQLSQFLRMGACLIGLGCYEEADVMYSKALEIDPKQKDTVKDHRIKWLHEVKEQLMKADISVAQSKGQQTAEWNARAVLFYETKDYAKAVECMTEAITIDPGNTSLYGNRSLYYMFMRNFDLALKDAEVWTANNPTESRHFMRLGACLHGLGRCKEADAMYRKAAEMASANQKSVWQNRREWLQFAAQSPERAAQQKVKSEWNGKAVAFYEAGNYCKAAECMTEAIKEEPDNLVLYGNRALYYLLAHQFELALKDAEVWTANNPTEGRHFMRLGACLMGLERYEEADAMYSKAVEKDPAYKAVFLENRKKWLEIAHERSLKAKETEKKTDSGAKQGWFAALTNLFFGSTSAANEERHDEQHSHDVPIAVDGFDNNGNLRNRRVRNENIES